MLTQINKTLSTHPRAIKWIKGIIAALLIIMVLIDVVLVALEARCYPTFSWVVRDNRTHLIWLVFLFGGLVAKIFYNRTVKTPEAETKGFFAFAAVVLFLMVLGRQCVVPMDATTGALLLISGGMFAHGIWPQYGVSGEEG